MLRPLRQQEGLTRSMTVCVAALAAKSRAIVLISDKSLAFGEMVSESNVCKMSQFLDRPWYIMLSGDLSYGDEVLLESETLLAQDSSKFSTDTLNSMMTLMSTAYLHVYQRHLEISVFAPKLLSSNDVYKRPRKYLPLPDTVSNEVEIDRRQFEQDWDCSLLVCGFDAQQHPHIMRIVKPGRATPTIELATR